MKRFMLSASAAQARAAGTAAALGRSGRGDIMSMRIWHQSYTDLLTRLPGYACMLAEHTRMS